MRRALFWAGLIAAWLLIVVYVLPDVPDCRAVVCLIVEYA